MVGWRWLYYTQQSTQVQSYGDGSNNWIATGTFATADGVRHPNSYELLINPGNAVTLSARSDGCDRLAATISTSSGSGPVEFRAYSVSPAQSQVLSAGANQLLNLPLNAAYTEAELSFYVPGSFARVVAAEPRLHCSVNTLKAY